MSENPMSSARIRTMLGRLCGAAPAPSPVPSPAPAAPAAPFATVPRNERRFIIGGSPGFGSPLRMLLLRQEGGLPVTEATPQDSVELVGAVFVDHAPQELLLSFEGPCRDGVRIDERGQGLAELPLDRRGCRLPRQILQLTG